LSLLHFMHVHASIPCSLALSAVSHSMSSGGLFVLAANDQSGGIPRIAKVLDSVDIVRVRVGVHAADVSRLVCPGPRPVAN